jgi:mannose-6-phosphate isomerase
MYDYGRPRELHVDKSLEATRLTTRAGKVLPKSLEDRTILLDAEYFRIERIPITGSRAGSSLTGAGESGPGLAYLFAAAGAGKISGPGFEPVDLPPRGVVAVPAASPTFLVEDQGALDLIRIKPNWPGKSV